MKNSFVLIFFVMLGLQAFAQKNFLQSGPMVGYSEMREVLLWVQTNAPADVQFAYWERTTTASTTDTFLTETRRTTASQAFTAKLVADRVQPDKFYAYALRINGKNVELPYATTFQTQPLWQWRTDPPPFRMALGSCAYVNEPVYDRPGTPYGGEYEIFNAIHAKQPNMMLWLGDNTYLREADWYTLTGIFHRYTHSRSLSEMQPLLASAHHYAIWDDHDYGPNNSDRSFLHKDKTRRAFELFWANPSFGLPDDEGGITSQFLFHDIEFFLLDNRYFRSPNDRTTTERTILGKKQLEWLIDALRNSFSPFKMIVIGGQVLNSVADGENYAAYQEELDYLLKTIETEGIKGVIFLTGDRHHTELSKIKTESGFTAFDLTVSPLTSGFGKGAAKEKNLNRVEGTLAMERNFATIDVTGKRKERQLLIQVFNVKGEKLWDYKIQEKDF